MFKNPQIFSELSVKGQKWFCSSCNDR